MIRALGAAALALLAAGAPAQAGMMQLNPFPCAARADVDQILREHGQRRVAVSLSGSTLLVEVWSNDEKGTGAVTITTVSGQMCLVLELAAMAWFTEPPPEGREG